MSERKEIVKKFWGLFSEAKFAGAKSLLHPDIVVWWPNTREVFRGRDRFLAVNEEYPGRWIIHIEKLISKDETVVSVTHVESIDQAQSFYAISFFTIKDGLIHEITEYWSDNGNPPALRIENALSEMY